MMKATQSPLSSKSPEPVPCCRRACGGQGGPCRASRSAHGEWEPSADRPDPVELLEEHSSSRVPELVPIRYGRMLVSPFTFFRGATLPMAADLAGAADEPSGSTVRRCPSGQLRGLRCARPDPGLQHERLRRDAAGPFEWGVKRLAASFAVAGRDRGFGAKERRAINTAVTRAYRGGNSFDRALASFAERTPTRTSATTALYRTRSRPGASWPSTASSPGSSHRDDEHPETRA